MRTRPAPRRRATPARNGARTIQTASWFLPPCSGAGGATAASALEDAQQLFQLHPHLAHDLLALGDVAAGLLALQLLACAADGEALLVQQAPDLADHDHVLALVVAAVAAALHRLELGELLLPVAQHMRLDAAQLAHLADGEVTLARDGGQLVIVPGFQHRLPRAPSASGRGGRSPRAAR